MRKFIIPILTMILISCGSKKGTVAPPSQAGQAKVVAVYTNPDGTKQIDIMLRVIKKDIVTDSVKKVDRIIIDTLWGRPDVVPIKDSTGKQVLDSLGKPRYVTNYLAISKDSVNWKIAGIPLDSLLKK